MVLMLPYFAESPYPVASKVSVPPTPSKGPRCKRRAGSPEESQPAPANNSIRQQRNLTQERINPRRPQSVTGRPKQQGQEGTEAPPPIPTFQPAAMPYSEFSDPGDAAEVDALDPSWSMHTG